MVMVVMLRHSRGDREDVGVEDNVFGRESCLLCQETIGTLADGNAAFVGGGLPFLIEGHDDDGSRSEAASAEGGDR